MAVLKNTTLDDVIIDPKLPANINYVKARMAIEGAGLARSERRGAKMVLISHLKGEIRHPDPAARVKGATNQVVFNDGTKARF